MSIAETGAADDDPRMLLAARLRLLVKASVLDQQGVARRATEILAKRATETSGHARRPIQAEKVSPQRLSAWIAGQNTPASQSTLMAVVAAALKQLRVGHGLSGEILDPAAWRVLYEAAAAASGPLAAPLHGTVAAITLHEVGVHRALPASGTVNEELTPYLLRDHDRILREVLEPISDPGGSARSVLVMLTGESSVGKTRALYEAVTAIVPDWKLARPIDAEDLLSLLDGDGVSRRTVLWLNEAQKFFYGVNGVRAAKALAQLLDRVPQVIAVGAMWSSPYWAELTMGGVPGRQAVRELLIQRSFRISVPAVLEIEEQRAFAALAASDRRVQDAIVGGALAGGRVIQHLTGGPLLVGAYLDSDPTRSAGGPFLPVEHALITAAIDICRLGLPGLIPAHLLSEAAAGYLSSQDLPIDSRTFETALKALACGYRADGTRTDVSHALTALTLHHRAAGEQPCYQPNDYLLQQIEARRKDVLPPPEFWSAARHAPPDTLLAIAVSADRRGLYREAAQLHKHNIQQGMAWSSHGLLRRMKAIDPADHRPSGWLATHASCADPYDIAGILRSLRSDQEEFNVLAARAARQVPIANIRGLVDLLEILVSVETTGPFEILADRVASKIPITDLPALISLLKMLHEGQASGAFTSLVQRLFSDLPFAELGHFGVLVSSLWDWDAEACRALIDLIIPALPELVVADPGGIGEILGDMPNSHIPHELGAALHDSIYRVVPDLPLADPGGVGVFLDNMRANGLFSPALTDRVARAAPELLRVDPSDFAGVLVLLRAARVAAPFAVMADRAADEIPLTDASTLCAVLSALQIVGLKLWNMEEYEPDSVEKFNAVDAFRRLADRIAANALLPAEAWLSILMLLDIREAGGAVIKLAERAARDPQFADITGFMLNILRRMETQGGEKAFRTLAHHIATEYPIVDKIDYGQILEAMRKSGEIWEFRALAERLCRGTPSGMVQVLEQLRKGEAYRALKLLVGRLPNIGHFELYLKETRQRGAFRYGRETSLLAPNNRFIPTARWGWDDLV